MELRGSRRWFVAAVGGVAAAAASATMVWRNRRSPTELRLRPQAADSPGYVDHDGWIVTPADQQQLTTGAAAPGAPATRPDAGAAGER